MGRGLPSRPPAGRSARSTGEPAGEGRARPHREPSGSGGSGTPQVAPLLLDGGVVPQPLRGDRAPPADIAAKDTTKEVISGYSLEAVLRASDVAAPAKGVDGAGLEAARKKTESRLFLDVTPARARIVLGTGFVFRFAVQGGD